MAEPACDIGQLDAHLLEAVLARLDGPSLAVASCVNKTWKSAVEADRLWKVVYEAAAPKPFQENTAAQLPAMLEAAGGWRQLFAWRHRLEAAPRSRLWIEAAGKASERCHFVSLPVTLEDAATPVAGQGDRIDENDSALTAYHNHYSTWSPDGAFVAYTLVVRSTLGILGSSISVAVIIKDAAGRTRVRADLQQRYPPFFYLWSPCGTRLAMLSNFYHMQVALRVLEVPMAALVAGKFAAEPQNVALVAVGRPLFIAWKPDSRRIVQCVDCERVSVLDIDAALAAGGDAARQVVPGTERAALSEAHVEGLRAPQWLLTPEGHELMLLPETATEWPGVDSVRSALVLVSPPSEDSAAQAQPGGSAAASAPWSCTLGHFEGGHVSFNAAPDASAIAWLTAGHEVWAVLRQNPGGDVGGGGDGMPTYCAPHKAYPPDAPFPAGLHAPLGWGRPVAHQWSPDGRRCALLVLSDAFGAEPYGQLEAQAARWVVWELGPDGAPALTVCAQHHASQAFVQQQQSFYDSYAQSGTPWSPASDALCFSAISYDGEDEDVLRREGRADGVDKFELPEEFGVYVQPLPPPGAAAGGIPGGGGGPILTIAPSPVRVAEGMSAMWSPR